MSQPRLSIREIRSSVAASERSRGSMLGPDLRLVVQHLMQHGVHRRQLVLQPVLELVDQQLAVVFFLDQAFGDPALLDEDRAIVLDAPDGERADDQIERQQGEPGVIGKGIAEIDDDAEHAADKRRDDADRGGRRTRRQRTRPGNRA